MTASRDLRIFFYTMLSRLPGARGRRYARKRQAAREPIVQADFDRALKAVKGSICIDLGANVGTWTIAMARHAGRVIAFEPDPWTVERLRENVAHLTHVEVVHAAVDARDDTRPLYRRIDFDADPALASESSSLLADKRNVDAENAVSVPVIDFVAYLTRLQTDIGVLKIDIEGSEVALMERLLADPVCDRISHIFVETHERSLPDLAARTAALRRTANSRKHPKIEMDWH